MADEYFARLESFLIRYKDRSLKYREIDSRITQIFDFQGANIPKHLPPLTEII